MTWDFWKDNKDAITTIIAVLLFLGSVGGGIWVVFKWGILRWLTDRTRGDVKAFEVISDAATLLPKLYLTENDDSPLADHNIKYQPRDPKRDMQAELKAALNRKRYLLVTAPTGYGKTREAGMLAQTMMLEGWRVLRVKLDEWLDLPKTLPKELGGNRSRVLILLDDLNGLFSAGNRTQSPRVEGEKTLMLNQLSYHDRLLQVLDMLEGMCTPSEIRVIATARSEAEQWQVLEYNESDNLWKRFEKVELPEPVDMAIVDLLEDSTKEAGMKGNENDFAAIAHKSDGTYRNIILNLRRWNVQNKDVNKNDFTETLNGSWQEIYEGALKKHAVVRFVYDAMDILQQARIDLFPFLVEPTALMLRGGNYWQRLMRQREISRAMHYLTEETSILRQANGELTPGDGQIKVGRDVVLWKDHLQFLIQLLLNAKSKKTAGSIYGMSERCYIENLFEQSLELINKYIALKPADANAYYSLGVVLNSLKRYDEAEDVYRKAIEFNPADANAYYGLGYLLGDLKRYEEAEAAYRKVIELNPADTSAYFNLGYLLGDLKRYEEAEAAYCKVIELNPADASAYSNLGYLLSNLKRYEEAEAAYRKAIELNPADASAHSNLGYLLGDLKRYDEAEATYRKAIELNPADPSAHYNLGYLLGDLKRYDEAEAAYRKVIELSPADPNAHYKLGYLPSDPKQYEGVEAAYRKAIELNPAKAGAYNNLSTMLRTIGREEEALPLLEKVIEFDPEDFNAYLGIVSIKKILGEAIEPVFVEKARLFMPEDDLYNRACLESVCDQFDAAFEYLKKAAGKEGFPAVWAWKDPDLKWIRGDARFVEIVGPPPA